MTEPTNNLTNSSPEDPAVLSPSVDRDPSLRLWWAAGVAFVALVALIAVFADTGDKRSTAGLDAFEFQTEDGGTVTLADFRGTPVVVNYFATWCPACRAELPEFEAVHQAVGDDVTFLGVSRDNVTSSWRSLVVDAGLTYQTVFEGNVEGSFAFVDARAMPTTVFIDADGEVQQVWSGTLSDDHLRDLIDEHFA